MKLKEGCLFIVPRYLEVCDSRGLQFAKICHKCSHPGVQEMLQNLYKKMHHWHETKIARVAAALAALQCLSALFLRTQENPISRLFETRSSTLSTLFCIVFTLLRKGTVNFD